MLLTLGPELHLKGLRPKWAGFYQLTDGRFEQVNDGFSIEECIVKAGILPPLRLVNLLDLNLPLTFIEVALPLLE